MINGGVSEPLNLQRGTRQGCPLSPSLFLLALEPLLKDIKTNDHIKGININKTTVKLAAYADDILVITESPEHSITALMESIQKYSAVSGYKLNKEKSECKPLNIHTHREVLGNSGLAWQTGHIKYLGIYFTNDLKSSLDQNEEQLLRKIKELLEGWSPRYITWWGRIETIKMMITPMVNYLANMLPLMLTDEFHRKLDKAINSFIWKGKKARISLKKLRLSKKLGGLNIMDFRTFQTACLAKQGAYWVQPAQEYVPVWLEVERAIMNGLDPIALLTANRHPEAKNRILRNTKTARLKVDNKLEKHKEL